MVYIVTFLLSLIFSFSVLFAEEKTEQMLEEVVVTATRTERATEEIPAGVSVITKQEIEDTRMFNVKDALIGTPGVQAESRNGAYDARLIIRGTGLKARYGVREIMVLLDGVPITDPDGLTRLDFVDTQLVDRIDIVKGPNSTLYGANAAGGVINIITKSPFEEIKSVKLGYGNYNTQMYNLTYGNHHGNTYFTLSGSGRSTDSWREWNEFSTNQGSLKIGHSFDEKTTLEASLSYTKADLQLPGTLTKEQFESDISQLTSGQWRHMGRYSEVFYSSIKLEKEIGDIKLKPLIFYQTWHHYHPVTGLINDGGAGVYGADIQADIEHNLFGIKGTFTGGITGQIDRADGERYTYRDYVTNQQGRILYTLSDEKGELAETEKDTTRKWGIYLQESLRPSDRWIIDLGVRYDQVLFDIDAEQYIVYSYAQGRYVTSRESISREKTFDYVSPRIGVVYKLSRSLNLYGNISTGFQTPQSSELSLNKDLEPLKTINYETGLKARFDGGHSIDLSIFYMTVKDEIVQTILPGNISSYSNAGESERKGIEFSGKAQIIKGLFLGASYTYSDFKFKEFIEPVRQGQTYVYYDRSGNRYPYIPTHQYSLFVTYRHPSGFKFKIDTNTWGRYYVDNANSETYKGYKFLTNLLIGYEKKGLDIGIDIQNLFDKRYAMEVTKEVGGTTQYRPGAPLTMMARVTYKF